MVIVAIIYILIFVIFTLVVLAVMQIKLAGLNIKDFWGFIQANDMLDKLYVFSRRYEKMSAQEQVIFLMEAEKVFAAFDKVPNILWEDEYQKYSQVLNTYQNLKVMRWVG